MSLANRRTLISAAVALLVGLAIYSIAQGSDLLPLGAQSAPQPAPQNKAPESAAPAVLQQVLEIPSGAVMYFNLPECPDGWTELTAAQGRVIVGLPDSGTLGAAVGTPLSDQENRAVGQHTHTLDDPGHGHTVSDPGHSHVVNDPGHNHSINDPGHTHTIWQDGNDDYGEPPSADCGLERDWTQETSSSTTGISINSSTTGISLGSNTTGISLINNTTGVTVDEAGSIAGTNAPYIQLLVCQKN